MDIKAEAEKLRTMYADDPRKDTFNALIYGSSGTGKTSLLRTCRKPVLIHSFDPGGTKVLRDEIAEGSIISDVRYENEDARHPTVYNEWIKETQRLAKMDFFSSLGTFAVDSITTWAQTIMNEVLKIAGRAGLQPQQNDWYPQMIRIEQAVHDIVSLPCDVVMIGHDDVTKDETTGRMFAGLLITGKLSRRIPLLFDEYYCAQTKETSKGVEYQLLTRSTGMYQARTRLGKGGELETYEQPDIKAILKKVGLSTEDKPSI